MTPLSLLRWLYLAFFKKDEYYRFLISEKIWSLFYDKLVYWEFGKLFLNNLPFIKDYRKFEWWNNHSLDRKWAVVEFLKLTKWLDGDTVECWCFKGATSYFILKNINPNKNHHIFDSFDGLSEPNEIDWMHWKKWDLVSTEDETRRNLSEFNNVKYYKWWIPERFNEVENLKFSFVHLDVDLYEPTRDSLDFFYPRLQKWGIIICDDSGFITCPWATKAMNEFAEENHIEILNLPTWQWIIIK